MYKKAIMWWTICGTLGLCASLSVCAETEAARPDIPVRVWMGSMSVRPIDPPEDGKAHQSKKEPRELAFVLNAGIPSSCCFGDHPANEEQELTLTDSAGHPLSPVQFDMSWLSFRDTGEEGMLYTYVTGIASELPPEGTSWVRLQGTLRLPVARCMESPIYELPLKERAEMEVPLPVDDEGTVVAEDVVVGVEDTVGILSLTNLESVERYGKKALRVGLALQGTVPWELIRFELVDKDGNALTVYYVGGSSRSSSESWEKEERYEVEPWEGMNQLRVKLIYKAGLKNVPVPVDMKIGLRGELPGDK